MALVGYFLVANSGGHVVPRSGPAPVRSEVERLIDRYGAREIAYRDDTMTLNEKWMSDLVRIGTTS